MSLHSNTSFPTRFHFPTGNLSEFHFHFHSHSPPPSLFLLPTRHYHHRHASLLPELRIPSPRTSLHQFNLKKSTKSTTMASSGAPTEEETKPFSVLFVCLGNICRSPAAEGVFKDLVNKRGLSSKFNIDSAGTIDYHEGNPADSRMRSAAKKRGTEITSISRPIRSSDFNDFDLIIAMDMKNRVDILRAFDEWKLRESLPAEEALNKVKLMCSYCKQHKETEVPDPYYGGPAGFEKVLDLLEDACESLLDNIVSENQHILGHP